MLNLFQHLILYQLLTLHSELLIVLEPTVGIEPTLKSLPMTRFTTKLSRHLGSLDVNSPFDVNLFTLNEVKGAG